MTVVPLGVDEAFAPRGSRRAAASCPRASRRRSCCTSAICTSGAICRCWSTRCSRRGAIRRAAAAVAGAGRRRSRRRRRRCARWRPRRARPTRSSVLGVVDETRLRALYRGAAALVYPSLYEGFGLPLLEAMASGTPVIASRAASIPEVARRRRHAARSATTPRLDDGDRRASSNDERAARATARRRPARARPTFTWERTARLTLEVVSRGVDAPDVSVVIVTWNGRQYLDACLHGRCRRSRASTPRRSSWTTARPTARRRTCARGFPWVRLVRAAGESRLCRRQQRRRARGARPITSRSSTTTPWPIPAGCARCVAGLDEPRGLRAGDVAHRLHARPGGDRQRRRRRAALGRRVQAASRRAGASRRRVAGSVRRLRRRVPDAEGGVRRARRVRRGLLRLARGRRSVVSRAAARLPVPLRRRRGRAASRQRDARHASARLPSSTASATWNGCTSRTRPARCSLRTLPGHLVYNAAAAAHFARARPARHVPAREGRGAGRPARACCASGRRYSARGASAPPPSGRSSSRGWLATKLREKRFDVGLAEQAR